MKNTNLNIFLFLTICLFFSCSNRPPQLFSKEIVDYVHMPNTHPLFEKADGLKYEQDYLKAISIYDSLLLIPMSKHDSIYGLNQLIYLNLLVYRDSTAKQLIQKFDSHFTVIQHLTEKEQADYYFNKGLMAYRLFHPKSAISGLQKALTLYKSIYQTNHLKIAQCYTQLGMLYYDIIGISDSINHYALAAYDIVLSSPLIKKKSANTELLMAITKWLKRNYDLAIVHAENARYCANNQPWVDTIIAASAECYKGQMLKKKSAYVNLELKKIYFDSSVIYFKLAIALIKDKNNSRIQELYKHLLIFYIDKNDQKEFNDKLDTLRKIVKIQRNYHAFEERLIAYNALINGDYRKSIDYYLHFLKKYGKDSICNNLLIEEAYYCLIENYWQTSKYDSAIYFVGKRFLRDTSIKSNDLSVDEILNKHLYQSTFNSFVYLDLMGKTLFDKYKKNKDIKTLKQVLITYITTDSLLFSRLSTQNDDIVLTFLYEVGNILYSNALEVVWLLYSETHDNTYLSFALRFIERMKGNVLYRDISQNLPSDRMSLLKSESDRLLGVRSTKSSWNYELSNKLALTFYEFDKISNISNTKDFSPIPTLAEIQNNLQHNQAIVEYSLGHKLHGLYIGKDTVIFFQKDTVILKNNLINYRRCLAEFDPQEIETFEVEFKESAFQLYNILLRPIENYIKNLNDLIIIPDRVLNHIPFESLVSHDNWKGFKNAPYFINQTKALISYSPAWKILNVKLKNTNQFSENLRTILFSYGSTRELPCSSKEIEGIEKILGKNRINVYLNEKCTKNQFLNIFSEKFDILHLSLHGKGNLNSPFDNKIWFQPNHNDSLFGFELSGKILKAPLVILSGCETALGDATAGEGAYSLARNFFQIGANNIIASLWQIDDCINSDVMLNFYVELKKQTTPNYALTKAKRDFLARYADNVSACPAYWAGIVCLD